MSRIIIPSEIEKLATLAVDAAFAVHSELGPGLLESVYQACFTRELELRGVRYQKELAVPLTYKGERIEVRSHKIVAPCCPGIPFRPFRLFY